MAELLQNFLVIASFFGVLYAPFHYLDRFASAEARAKARSAIRAGQSHIDAKSLGTLLDAVFGARHLTGRCFLLSCVVSTVFTLLSLGAVNAYANLVDQIERREERRAAAERALNEANARLLEAVNGIIKAIGSDPTPNVRRAREEMEKRKAEIESMLRNPFPSPPKILVWMLASVLVSLNFLCDYVALGKTRLILRQINKTTSRVKTSAYLLLDLLLAGVIWLASIAVFVTINTDSFLSWANEEPFLVSASASSRFGQRSLHLSGSPPFCLAELSQRTPGV